MIDCASFSGTPSVAVDLAQPRNSGTALTLSLPRVINFNLSCSLTRNRTSHSMKNLAFHGLLRWKMILLTNSHYITKHFSLGGWENVLLELGSERVKLYTSNWKGSPATPIQTKKEHYPGKQICFNDLFGRKVESDDWTATRSDAGKLAILCPCTRRTIITLQSR